MVLKCGFYCLGSEAEAVVRKCVDVTLKGLRCFTVLVYGVAPSERADNWE